METYRYRVRFYLNKKGSIKYPEQKFNIEFPDNTTAYLSCLDAESIAEGRELVISAGGFKTEDESFRTGRQIKTCILIAAAKLRIGVDAGKDISNFWSNPSIKEKVFNDYGVKIINDIHGLSVYSEKHPVAVERSSSVSVVRLTGVEEFIDYIGKYQALSERISDKEMLALELYGASHFEKSERAKFLTQILCAESLLSPVARSESEKEIIDCLISSVKGASIDNREKQSMIGSLKLLYNKSISQSLKGMACDYIGQNIYNELPAQKFILQCYGARSKLVHTGSVKNSDFKIGTLSANLDVYLSDLLSAIIESKGT